MATRRYKDIVLRYTDNFNRDFLVRQRTYVTQDGSFFTPIAPTVMTRFIDPKTKLPKPLNLIPRKLVSCGKNPDNLTGISEFSTVIPFNSAMKEHNQAIKETTLYDKVLTIRYEGEQLKL